MVSEILKDLEAHEHRIMAAAFLPDPSRPWLSTQEVAKLYGVHDNTVHRWRQSGRLRGSRGTFGGHWHYHIVDLLDFKEPPRSKEET